MKKVILIAASLVAFASCIKDVDVTSEKGYLRFNLAADDIVVTTKAVVAADELNAYTVHVGETSYNYGENIKNQTLTLDPKKYVIYAENMTPDAAHEDNGALRLASEAKEVTITAGNTEVVSLACKAVNAKITVNFDASFKAAFSSYEVKIGYKDVDDKDNRRLTIASDADCFYNIRPDGKGLNLNLTATPRVGAQNAKTNSTDLAIQAGYHYTVSYSAGTSGYVSITVTADDTLIDVAPQNITVNPYQS